MLNIVTNKPEPRWIKANDVEIFGGTQFYSKNPESFSFQVQPLTAGEFATVQRSIAFSDEETSAATSLFCYGVKDWKGITIDGEEIACTEENKKRLADLQTGLIGLIIQALVPAHVVISEDEEKN